MEISDLKLLIQAMDQSDIAELILENPNGGLRLTLRKPSAVLPPAIDPSGAASVSVTPPAPTQVAPPVETAEVAAQPAQSDEEEFDEQSHVTITAPMVGTFYRAPAPDAAPYVRLGDKIEPGQALCIIEAMKLMNEIESEVKGRIVKILVENGDPVEYGEPLFVVELE